MTWDWQSLIVFAAIMVAGVYLARVGWQTVLRRRAAACGGCGTCPAAGHAEPEVFGLATSGSRHESNGAAAQGD